MSYVRFGADSDVYVYFDVHGQWVIHVAESRFVAHPQHPVPPLPTAGQSDFAEQLMAHYEAQEHGSYEPIEAAEAGTEFRVDSADECLTQLTTLRDNGFRIPQYAIDAVGRDAALRSERS